MKLQQNNVNPGVSLDILFSKEKTMLKNPEILKCLEVSTSHITEKDNNLMIEDENHHTSPLIIYNYEHGMFVYIPSTEFNIFIKKIKDFGYSKQFQKLLRTAKNANCRYLQLDNAGAEYSELETFEW